MRVRDLLEKYFNHGSEFGKIGFTRRLYRRGAARAGRCVGDEKFPSLKREQF